MLARLALDRRVILAAIVALAVVLRLAGVGDRLTSDVEKQRVRRAFW